jgi:hypothetical protein
LTTNAIYVKQKTPIYGGQFKNNWILIFGDVLDWNVPEDYSRVNIALSDWSQFFPLPGPVG